MENNALNKSDYDAGPNTQLEAQVDAQSSLDAQSPLAPSVEPAVTMTYPNSVIRRAQRAVFCSPFYHKLLAEMRVSSVSVPTIAENSGALKGYTQQPLSEVATESELMWLVSVGILRREVDGQGLTDSFRLTPLGRRVVELWQSQGCPDRRANLVDYMKNAVVRWCRVPDWLA